jgi:hypothetical protein
MARTSHIRTVRERVVDLLRDDNDFDHISIEEGPISLVKLKYPCIIVAVTAQRFYPVAIGGRYDRELQVRVDCYDKEYGTEDAMEKVESMADDVVDNLIDNYSLTKSGDPAVRLATGYVITYDLIEAQELVLRNAALIFTTEKEKE